MSTGRAVLPKPASPAEHPRVAVGIPVRDGASSLEMALESVLGQSYSNLEILISDNCSSDATAEICQKYAKNDPRIRYTRQPELIPADQNFRFVLEECRSEWFLWASHDDLRDPNYIETLLKGFVAHPEAVLVVSDVGVFSNHARAGEVRRNERCPRTTTGVPFPERHSAVVEGTALQLYGLFRTSVLRMYPWPAVPVGHDWLILHWMAAVGEIVYVPGTLFRYFVPEKLRSSSASNAYHWLRSRSVLDALRAVPDVRWAVQAGKQISAVRTARGLDTNRASLFLDFCFIQHGGFKVWAKSFAYYNSPLGAREVWRALARRSS